MPRGRKSRARRFPNIAENWKRDKGRNSELKILDERAVIVGKKSTRHVIEKRFSDHALVGKLRAHLEAYMKKNGIKPSHFTLVEPIEHRDNAQWVQEYFGRPSMRALSNFLHYKEKKILMRFMSGEEYYACKRFVKNPVNKGITLQKIDEAWKELLAIRQATFPETWITPTFISKEDLPIIAANVICLGINRDGRLRLAIVDV